MMRRLFALVLISSLLSTAVSFAPTISVPITTKTATPTQLGYKNRDDIARELIELIPGEHRSQSKDFSPWKRIMELEHAEDKVRELQKKLDKMKKEERALDHMEQMVHTLFLQIVFLTNERNSVKKLLKRLFHTMSRRINTRVGRNVDRILKALHMFHPYE